MSNPNQKLPPKRDTTELANKLRLNLKRRKTQVKKNNEKKDDETK